MLVSQLLAQRFVRRSAIQRRVRAVAVRKYILALQTSEVFCQVSFIAASPFQPQLGNRKEIHSRLTAPSTKSCADFPSLTVSHPPEHSLRGNSEQLLRFGCENRG